MNPTQDQLEATLAALEGGAAALALASGTSAVYYAIINICSAGDEIVSANNLYGGTYTMFDAILPQFGIHTRFVDPRDPNTFEPAINERTRAIYIEAIGNPVLEVVDIEAIAEIARAHNLPLIVDATFTTPYLLRSIDYGADIVCGDIQPLGVPMNYGGGLAGFIASHDDERVVMEYPSRLFGIAPTKVPGEYGFGDVAYELDDVFSDLTDRYPEIAFFSGMNALSARARRMTMARNGPGLSMNATEMSRPLLSTPVSSRIFRRLRPSRRSRQTIATRKKNRRVLM